MGLHQGYPARIIESYANSDMQMGRVRESDPRPEGPAENRPDRKVGIRLGLATSTEGAALSQRHTAYQIRFHGSGSVQGILVENPVPDDAHADCGYIQSLHAPQNDSR